MQIANKTSPAIMCLVLLVLMLGVSSSQAEELEVSASIKPLHSLISIVMEGKGEPMLIMGDGASPHSSSLKPSQRRMMAQSEVIFVVHEGWKRRCPDHFSRAMPELY